MTFKKYVQLSLLFTLFWVGLFALFNYIQDDFGLFRKNSTKRRIWVQEKTSKYLMSYNYIGNNFDGILIGSSVSANLNPTFLLPKYKVYNLSMNGGNITELKYAVDRLFEKKQIHYMILCLHPYMTKNSGLKDNQINKNEYWRSFFSVLPAHILIEKAWCLIGAPDVFHSSENGFNDYNIFTKNFNLEKKIRASKGQTYDVFLNSIALNTLKELLSEARNKNIRIIAYYFPIYKEIFKTYSLESWLDYKSKIDAFFKGNDTVIDMNSKQYRFINENIKNYSDGHLSDQGAAAVLKEIGYQLDIAIQ